MKISNSYQDYKKYFDKTFSVFLNFILKIEIINYLEKLENY